LALLGAPLEIARQLSSSTPSLLNELITALSAAFKRDHAPLEAVRRFAEHDVRRFIDALEALVQSADPATRRALSKSPAAACERTCRVTGNRK
jgi:hypothetical protein